MKPYENHSGQSSVKAYQLYLDAIKIQFTDESVYLFTNENCGIKQITQLKILAKNGDGLENYIRQNQLLDKADRLEG